jgi:hypothetical protein
MFLNVFSFPPIPELGCAMPRVCSSHGRWTYLKLKNVVDLVELLLISAV